MARVSQPRSRNRRASLLTPRHCGLLTPKQALFGPLNWKVKVNYPPLLVKDFFPGAIRSGLARRQNFNMQSESNFLAEIST